MYVRCAALDTDGLKDPKLHEHTKISALYNLGRLYADQDRLPVSPHKFAILEYYSCLINILL